jgi:hypothetical protein
MEEAVKIEEGDNIKMDTLTERIEYLKKSGYREEFKIVGKKLQTADGSESFSPSQIKINEHYRFEGESDPGDMTVLYGIETEDGKKGILTDGFGTYSDPDQAEFLRKIKELHNGDIY